VLDVSGMTVTRADYLAALSCISPASQVTASVTYGCSLCHIRSQPLPHTVAASAAYGQRHLAHPRHLVTSLPRYHPSQRAVAPTSAPLPPHLAPLLGAPLAALRAVLAPIFPPAADAAAGGGGGGGRSAQRGAAASLCTELGVTAYPSVCRPHLLVHGPAANGQAVIALAAMHALEHCHLYAIDAAALAADGSRSPQEA